MEKLNQGATKWIKLTEKRSTRGRRLTTDIAEQRKLTKIALNSTLTDKIHQKLAEKTGPANTVASNFHLKKIKTKNIGI